MMNLPNTFSYWIDNNPQQQRIPCTARTIRILLLAGILTGDDQLYFHARDGEGLSLKESVFRSCIPHRLSFTHDMTDPRTIAQFLDGYRIRSHCDPFITQMVSWRNTLCHTVARDLSELNRRIVQYRFWGPIEASATQQRYMLRLELVTHDGVLSRQFYREIVLEGRCLDIELPSYNLSLAELVVEGQPHSGRFL